MQTSPRSEKKPLLKISNLKQYFPLKTKGLYVKANDGVTLDIYEGETLGLVGESGCGKSTLGRTILQLYRQTDGRTMYYGKSLDDIAPSYVGETIRTLNKRRVQLKELEKKRDALQKEYDAMTEEGHAKYTKLNELNQAKKEANDAFLDMANLLGGFIMVDDTKPVIDAFTNLYQHSSKQCELEQKLSAAQLVLDDAEFALETRKKAGKSTAGAESRRKKAQDKVNAIQAEIDEVKRELAAARAGIDEMRKQYANDPEFQRLESYRDAGIDLARLTYNEIRLLRSDGTLTASARALLVDQISQGERQATGIAKAPFVCQFVRTLLENGEKVLLFAHHHAVMDRYKEELRAFNPVFITGRETGGRKEEAAADFMEGRTDLCCISLRAASGLNLQRASCVVFGELDWSPAVHSQAEDRAHRIGQKDSLLCYYLVSPRGSDADIQEALGLKVSQFLGLMGERAQSPALMQADADFARKYVEKMMSSYE